MSSFGRLKIISGARAGTAWELHEEGSFPIGTNPKARFRLEDDEVEIVHAGLHCGPEGVFVDNRGKETPVRVNGATFPGRRQLRGGDVLLVGSVNLEYEAPTGTSATPPGRRPAADPPPRGEGESFVPATYSGRAPLQGILMGLGTGIAAGILMAFAYGYFELVNPCINILTVLLTVGFGVLTGVAAGVGMKWGKVRCRRSQGIVGAVVGLMALHMSWVVWVSAFLESRSRFISDHPVTITSLYFHPGDLLYEMGRIGDRGAWSLFGSWTPEGIVLGLIWLVEAAIIVGGAYFGASGFSPALFCEGCGTWGETRKAVLAIGSMEPESVKSHLEAGDLSFLAGTPPPEPGAASWIQVDLASCTGCGDARSLTLHTASLTAGDGKQPKVELKAIAEDLLITRQEAEWIETLSPPAGESAPVPAPKAPRFQWKK